MRRMSGNASRTIGFAGLISIFACYLAGAVFASVVGRVLLAQPATSGLRLDDPFFWSGFVLCTGLVFANRTPRHETYFWSLTWLLLGLLALANVSDRWISIPHYGDHNFILLRVAQGEPIPKWLGGIAALGWLSAFLDFCLGVAEGKNGLSRVASLLQYGAILVMTASTLALIWIRPARLAILLPTLTPLWLLFAAGHQEYYPLIAPVWLASLAWYFERPLGERSPYGIGFLAALLCPLLYLGFAPYVVILAGVSCIAMPRRSPYILGTAVLTSLIGIFLFFPPGIFPFFEGILDTSTLNLGDRNTHYWPYLGKSAGPNSIFFDWSYALSTAHLREVAFMGFFGAGALLIPFFALAAAGLPPHWRWWTTWSREPRVWMGIALFAWSIYYMVRMLPKLGPFLDIDLFFAAYLFLAFLVGLLFDANPKLAPGSAARTRILAAALGSACIGFEYILRYGITP